MNSRAASVARLRTHRPAIVACFVFLREIRRKAFGTFARHAIKQKEAADFTVFTEIDHAAVAKKIGLDMRPRTVIRSVRRPIDDRAVAGCALGEMVPASQLAPMTETNAKFKRLLA